MALISYGGQSSRLLILNNKFKVHKSNICTLSCASCVYLTVSLLRPSPLPAPLSDHILTVQSRLPLTANKHFTLQTNKQTDKQNLINNNYIVYKIMSTNNIKKQKQLNAEQSK